MAAPLTDVKHAVDCTLDARHELVAVRDSDLPGGRLYLAADSAVAKVDDLLRTLRALAVSS